MATSGAFTDTGSGPQAPQGAFEDEGADIDAANEAPDEADNDGSYASVHGPTLAALDDLINKRKQADNILAQHQAITSARVDNAKKTVDLAAQKHAIAASQTPDSAFNLSSGVQQPPQEGAFQKPAALANHPIKHDLSQFDIDQHLQNANYTDEHFADADKEMKAQTGKTSAEMYDELQHRGFIPPSDAKLTNRQKSELFIKFGIGMLKQNQARVVRPDQYVAPNALTEAANAGEGVLSDYDQMLASQRQGALTSYQEQQKIGAEAAKSKSEAEIEGQRTTSSANLKAAELGQSDINNERTNETRLEAARIRAAASKARSAGDGTWVPEPGADGTQREHNTKTGQVRVRKDENGKPMANTKETGVETAADKAKTAAQKELDSEQDQALKKADEMLGKYDRSTFVPDPKSGKPTAKQYSREELANRLVADMPAHQRAATSNAQAPKGDNSQLERQTYNGDVYEYHPEKGARNDQKAWVKVDESK